MLIFQNIRILQQLPKPAVAGSLRVEFFQRYPIQIT